MHKIHFLALCIIWTASSENVPSNMLKIRRFRSSFACAKYHPSLCSPFIHSVVSDDFVSGQWRPWSDCADAQADLGLRCPHMPDDTFLLGAANIPFTHMPDMFLFVETLFFHHLFFTQIILFYCINICNEDNYLVINTLMSTACFFEKSACHLQKLLRVASAL